MIDDDKEGILWLKFLPKGDETEFLCCVCYLPSINWTRNVDGNEFFDTLLSLIHMYCKDPAFFYARCEKLEDYIPGWIEVTDFTLNTNGKLLCGALLDSNCYHLNGRNNSVNNYTFTGALHQWTTVLSLMNTWTCSINLRLLRSQF